jgi:hypothetical protein
MFDLQQDSQVSLPYGGLATKILKSKLTSIPANEPEDTPDGPFGKQTILKSNAQLQRFQDSNELIPIFQTESSVASSSWSVLVLWPYSVFGQNHLCVMMRQTGIPLFRVKSEEFQSSLSAIRTMCHPVPTPICLLFHPSRQRVIPSGHQTDKHHLSGRRASSIRTPTSYREAFVPAYSIRTFQQHVRMPISSRTVH